MWSMSSVRVGGGWCRLHGRGGGRDCLRRWGGVDIACAGGVVADISCVGGGWADIGRLGGAVVEIVCAGGVRRPSRNEKQCSEM